MSLLFAEPIPVHDKNAIVPRITKRASAFQASRTERDLTCPLAQALDEGTYILESRSSTDRPQFLFRRFPSLSTRCLQVQLGTCFRPPYTTRKGESFFSVLPARDAKVGLVACQTGHAGGFTPVRSHGPAAEVPGQFPVRRLEPRENSLSCSPFSSPCCRVLSTTVAASCLHAPLSWSPDGQWLAYTVAEPLAWRRSSRGGSSPPRCESGGPSGEEPAGTGCPCCGRTGAIPDLGDGAGKPGLGDDRRFCLPALLAGMGTGWPSAALWPVRARPRGRRAGSAPRQVRGRRAGIAGPKAGDPDRSRRRALPGPAPVDPRAPGRLEPRRAVRGRAPARSVPRAADRPLGNGTPDQDARRCEPSCLVARWHPAGVHPPGGRGARQARVSRSSGRTSASAAR